MQNMNRILLSIIISFITFSMLCANSNELLNKANNYYQKKQFDSAVIVYKKILFTGSESPKLYYNLGNAYFKQKMLPQAILNYERAKKLAPIDEDIEFNLQLAQSMAIDKINVLPEFFIKTWFKAITGIFKPDTWAVISILFFITSLIITLLYLFTTSASTKKVTFWVVCVCLIISIKTAFMGFSEKANIEDKTKAIVMEPSVTIKSSPDEKGNDLFVIHEGAKVTITDEVGEWREIKIADGSKGWLRLTDIEVI